MAASSGSSKSAVAPTPQALPARHPLAALQALQERKTTQADCPARPAGGAAADAESGRVSAAAVATALIAGFQGSKRWKTAQLLTKNWLAPKWPGPAPVGMDFERRYNTALAAVRR